MVAQHATNLSDKAANQSLPSHETAPLKRICVRRRRSPIKVRKAQKYGNEFKIGPNVHVQQAFWSNNAAITKLQSGIVDVGDRCARVYSAIAEKKFYEARREVAEIAHLGGPEAAGAWGAVKIGTGIGVLLATGHIVAGGAICIWGGMAVASATAWGFNRESVHDWMIGEEHQGIWQQEEGSEEEGCDEDISVIDCSEDISVIDCS